jgi:hypothetical protein
MSGNQDSSPPEHRPAAPLDEGAGCLMLLGCVLLLPGVCAILMIGYDLKSALSASTLPIIVLLFAIAAAGIFLIWRGARGSPR